MKLWIDDIRQKPNEDYIWAKSVNAAKWTILMHEWMIKHKGSDPIKLIDIDYDAGDFAIDGGDYIKLLDWLEETDRNYPIRIHSMNPVGVANMRAIIQRNGWKEIF